MLGCDLLARGERLNPDVSAAVNARGDASSDQKACVARGGTVEATGGSGISPVSGATLRGVSVRDEFW